MSKAEMKGCGTVCGIEAALLLELLLGAEEGGVLCDALADGAIGAACDGHSATGDGHPATCDGHSAAGDPVSRVGERSYGAAEALRIEEMDATALKDLVRRASQRLRELETTPVQGSVQDALRGQARSSLQQGRRTSCPAAPSEAGTDAVTGIRVTRGGRIYLEGGGSASSIPGGQPSPGREILMKPLCKVLFLLFLRHPEGIRFKEISAYEDEMMELYGMVSRRDDVAAMRSSIRRICDMDSNCLNTHRSQLSRALARFTDGAALESLLIGGSRAGVRRITADSLRVVWE